MRIGWVDRFRLENETLTHSQAIKSSLLNNIWYGVLVFLAGYTRNLERQARRRQRQARGRQERRDNVVMVRVDEENLKRLDELVESGQFNSRSEATAFLISEGVKSKQQMFEKMATKVSQIQGLRTELAAMISEEIKSYDPVEQGADENVQPD